MCRTIMQETLLPDIVPEETIARLELRAATRHTTGGAADTTGLPMFDTEARTVSQTNLFGGGK